MADDADRAEELIEHRLEDALAEAHERAVVPEAEATGYCLDCGADLVAGMRFCNADCRDAWQHEHDLKMMTGVA